MKKLAVGCLATIGGVVVLLVIIGAIAGASHSSNSATNSATSLTANQGVQSNTTAQQPAQAPAASPTTVLNVQGSGIKSTDTFTARNPWALNWSYDCSGFGDRGNFIVSVFDQSGSEDFHDPGVNELGASGHDQEIYHNAGTFYLQVNSECDWSLNVVSS